MAMQIPIGYGPRAATLFLIVMDPSMSCGKKFLGYLRIQHLHQIVQSSTDQSDDIDFIEKNATVFAELIQYLDDKILSLVIRDAQYMPSFKQNIFSVQVATKNSVHTSFERDNYQLIYLHGAVFNITQRGHLYYLENIVSDRNPTYDLHTWHKILSHCNESDIKKSPNLVKGMKIKLIPNYAPNCDICIQGKMSDDRNKTLDYKQQKLLHLYTVI